MSACSALRAGPALHGTMLARFGHVYTATANRAEPVGTVSSSRALCWHGFKLQCKRSIID